MSALESTLHSPTLLSSMQNMANSDQDAASSGVSTPFSHPTTSQPSRGQSNSPWPAPAPALPLSTRLPSFSQPSNEYKARPAPPQHEHPTRGLAASHQGDDKSLSPSDQSARGRVRTTTALANLLRLDETLRDAEAYLRARDEYFGAWPSARAKGQEKAE